MHLYSFCLISLMLLAVSTEARRFHGSHARKHHSVLKGADDCRRVTCPQGSTCTIDESGLPECTCVTICPVHLNPTCGSDNRWYENHCDLHQTACVTDSKISVHHNNECFNRGVTCSGINKQTFKSRVLEHYTTQFKHPQHIDTTISDYKVSKTFLLGLIFNHYDLDQDDVISKNEVLVSMTRDELLPISTHCTMADVLAEHESDGDGKWSTAEFFEAFGVGGYELDESLRTKVTITTAGERLVLGCDIRGDSTPDVVWTRNGIALDQLKFIDGIQIYGDGNLYFTPVTTMHAGNYTCSIRGRILPTQTYTVRVKVPPTVRVCPENQLVATGTTAKFYCNAWGVPQPTISWQRNGLRLKENEVAALNNRTLTIKDSKTENSGRFICSARNDIGIEEVNAVLVEEEAILSHDPLRSLFYVFHKNGIMSIDPVTCEGHLRKLSNDMIPNTNEKLCNVFNKTGQLRCVWGGAVEVQNRFIYATQPMENRIVVVAIGNEQIVEYIKTETKPVSLQYVAHLDQVWFVSWGKKDQPSMRIVQVIPEASKFQAHHPIHMEPTKHHYDSIQSLYIPPKQIPGQGFFEYGFAHHDKELGLDKIDLKSMKKVSTLELVSHGCVPHALAYVSFGGYLVVSCGNSNTGKQLIIDYITEKVVEVNEHIKGVPKISPNGEFLVSIDYNEGAIFVQTISELGKVEQHFEIRANIIISDVAFFPSVTRDSYDMLLTPREDNEALFVNLKTGALKVITVNGQPINPDDWPPNEHNRHVVSDGLLDGYLATPMRESLLIFDTRSQKVHCDVGEIKYGNVIQPVSFC
ncbi:follistatin-related protein 5-like [Anneissia japonica]|uniref:follistatin-related protein 5-like n=1 Tax=Anneissia japonica TaxID=1529436 RepID=UPI00142576B1|nr:follistatin-related protein 5-like [Anneissia japonica]XP_033108248.1 follistatin-related protein 5-like [Anneissia japonica]